VGDVIIKVCFCLFGQGYLALGVNPTSQFLQKFIMEPGLTSESLEPLTSFLAYLEPKL